MTTSYGKHTHKSRANHTARPQSKKFKSLKFKLLLPLILLVVFSITIVSVVLQSRLINQISDNHFMHLDLNLTKMEIIANQSAPDNIPLMQQLLLLGFRGHHGERMFFADSSGTIIASTDNSLNNRSISSLGINYNSRQTDGILQTTLNGNGILMLFRPMGNSGWTAYATIDNIQDLGGFAQNAVIGIIITIIAAIILYLFVNRTTKNIIRIADVAYDIGQGKLSVNIPPMPNDETGILAEAFRNISQSILTLAHETDRISKEAAKGYLSVRADENIVSGDYKEILGSMNKVAGAVHFFFDNIPCSIVIFDESDNFTFVNQYTVNQGYDLRGLLGRNVFEGLPPEDAESVNRSLNDVRETGKVKKEKMPFHVPSGKLVIEEQVTIPLRDAAGNLICIMMAGYDVTEAVHATERAEKISTYQEFEANDISRILSEGLSKCMLHFRYTPKEHDEDTKIAALAYRKIMDALNISTSIIKSYVDEITQILEEIANKNFNLDIGRKYIGDFAPIKDYINAITMSVSALINEIQVLSAGVEAGSETIAQSTQELMMNFNNQADIINNAKIAITGLTQKTHKNAQDALEASELSDKVQSAAEAGNICMGDMSDAMREIQEAASKIVGVVSVIEDIALKTNLLALNASIEAARAGEHGRGFGVVAEEVRSLAGQSASAAKETAEMLTQSMNKVNIGAQMCMQTSEAFKNIVDFTTTVADVIGNIAAMSHEQAEEISKIQSSMEEIYMRTADNTEVVSTNTAVSEELSSQAGVLRSLVDQFKIKHR
ncbi:MAG: methyl-accepting chemotaxis protein [Defluviitaleaceae bacterium]|nr:methyl-accepting chemotaxis protein [Defluviitaleaceae bacterium]